MKKTVRVVKEFEYEIEIDDGILNQDFVTDFESAFWELEADTLEGKLSKLFEVAAYQLTNGEETFVEGIGYCTSKGMLPYREKDKLFHVIYDETYSNTEMEIVE